MNAITSCALASFRITRLVAHRIDMSMDKTADERGLIDSSGKISAVRIDSNQPQPHICPRSAMKTSAKSIAGATKRPQCKDRRTYAPKKGRNSVLFRKIKPQHVHYIFRSPLLYPQSLRLRPPRRASTTAIARNGTNPTRLTDCK